ncbi:MAG TPA: anthranilate synthase component I family protein [Bacteroidales bacterium]|nr:anthranilate synthase component I family protein [Bacteroidales bacterium]
MNRINFKCRTEELPADTLTPVSVYLRLRDIYPGSLLLECTDYSSRSNAFSYICLNPVLGIEANEKNILIWYLQSSENHHLNDLVGCVNEFVQTIHIEKNNNGLTGTEGLFGFTSFDTALFFEKFDKGLIEKALVNREVPFLKYDFFRVILSFNHFNGTLNIIEYYNDELPAGETSRILSILANHNFTGYPFCLEGEEQQLTDDSTFKSMVRKAVRHCEIGNVFQLVVSRRFRQKFNGDEFNVYRSLRSVNPSPYLFYFDYIGYKIFGSSPEAQIKISNGKAIINPIAGTIRRTGDQHADSIAAKELLNNPKENSEHVMLVDLARNDLSRKCTNVKVDVYREVQAFSHLWHLVSTVSGDFHGNESPFTVFAGSFPAGTLCGAPKHKAIELINELEPAARGYYGGAIGFLGLNNDLNHAIIIRSFLSRNGYLNYQAGAGIVVDSTEQGELNEVNNKLDALRTALKRASDYVKY